MEQSLKTDTQTVLIVGRRDYVLQTFSDIVRKAGFTPLTLSTDEEVFKALRAKTYSVLLLGGGVEPNSRIAFREYVIQNRPQVKIIEHFGGPATLLDELRSAVRA
jgi:hypothetical protein